MKKRLSAYEQFQLARTEGIDAINLLIGNAIEWVAEQERLNSLPKATFQDDMESVINKQLNVIEVEDTPIGGSNGENWTVVDGKPIYGKTRKELEATKDRMERGITGDKYLYQDLYLNGLKFTCKGRNEDELNKDILAAKEFAAKHSEVSLVQNTLGAVTFVGANYKPEDIEKISISGETFYIIYPEKVVVDTHFEIIADLSDMTSELNKADVKTLLMRKVEDIVNSRLELEEDYENYNEDEEEEDEEDIW